MKKDRFRENIPYPYKNSRPVDPSIYENDNYLFNVRPRISVFDDYANEAGWEVREEYFSIAAPNSAENHPWGLINPAVGNFMSFCWPEIEREQL